MFSAVNISKLTIIFVLICVVTKVTSALRCSNCFDSRSCGISPVATVECSEENVSLHHWLLGYPNPSLMATSAGNSANYKCFDVKLSYISTLTGSSVLVEEKGCTYAGKDFCEGWNTKISQVTRCSTCDSGDGCN